MLLDEYQELAARTIREDLTREQKTLHALHEMASEVGELHGLYQKMYQGHALQAEHAMKELGDLLWGMAEYCTSNGWKLSDVAQMNIDKLRARYPEGFREENSLHRAEGDI